MVNKVLTCRCFSLRCKNWIHKSCGSKQKNIIFKRIGNPHPNTITFTNALPYESTKETYRTLPKCLLVTGDFVFLKDFLHIKKKTKHKNHKIKKRRLCKQKCRSNQKSHHYNKKIFIYLFSFLNRSNNLAQCIIVITIFHKQKSDANPILANGSLLLHLVFASAAIFACQKAGSISSGRVALKTG